MKAKTQIDIGYAVPANDIMNGFKSWQEKLFKRFAMPPTKTGTSNKSGDPVTSDGKKWMVYSRDGILCYHRVARITIKLWEELACLANAAQYVGAPSDPSGLPPAGKKGKKRR